MTEPDEAALHRLWANGAKAWADVPDGAAWVDELRGNEPMTETDQFQPLRDALAAFPDPLPLVFGSYGAGVLVHSESGSKHDAACNTGRWALPWDSTAESRDAFNRAAAFVAAVNAAPALLTALDVAIGGGAQYGADLTAARAEVERLRRDLFEVTADRDSWSQQAADRLNDAARLAAELAAARVDADSMRQKLADVRASCATAVFVTALEAQEEDADDLGTQGWLDLAEERIRKGA